MAVSMPKQRFNPRATLYSPPPSHTRNSRVVAMRVSPGSSRSITSPRLTRSHRHLSFDLIFIAVITLVHHHCLLSGFADATPACEESKEPAANEATNCTDCL